MFFFPPPPQVFYDHKPLLTFIFLTYFFPLEFSRENNPNKETITTISFDKEKLPAELLSSIQKILNLHVNIDYKDSSDRFF
jgi:hypothetical protein